MECSSTNKKTGLTDKNMQMYRPVLAAFKHLFVLFSLYLCLPSLNCAATVAKAFVGGTQLKTTGGKTEEVKTAKPATTGTGAVPTNSAKTTGIVTTPEDEQDTVLLPGEKDVQPVGKSVRNGNNIVCRHQ